VRCQAWPASLPIWFIRHAACGATLTCRPIPMAPIALRSVTIAASVCRRLSETGVCAAALPVKALRRTSRNVHIAAAPHLRGSSRGASRYDGELSQAVVRTKRSRNEPLTMTLGQLLFKTRTELLRHMRLK